MRLLGCALLARACASQLPELTVTSSYWPVVDKGTYFGYQPTIPAVSLTGDGLIYLSSSAGNQCSQPVIKGFTAANGTAAAKQFDSPLTIPSGWCIDTFLPARQVVTDAILTASGTVATAFSGSNSGALLQGAIVGAVAAGTGAPVWTTIVAQYPSGKGTFQGITLLPGGQQLLVLVNEGSNATGYILDAAKGDVVALVAVPVTSTIGNCTGLGGNVNSIAATGTATNAVIVVDTSPSTYTRCTYMLRVVGADAGSVLWAAPLGGAFNPIIAEGASDSTTSDGGENEGKAARAFLQRAGAVTVSSEVKWQPASSVPVTVIFQNAPVLGGQMRVLGVASDGSQLWNTSLQAGYNFIAGAGATSTTAFVMASYSMWRGCAASVSTIYALDLVTGLMQASLPLRHFPDIGVQTGGALPVVLSPGDGSGDAVLFWRETNGWGAYDSYITGGWYSAANGTISVISALRGAERGVNVGHDDQGANPVKGCPPSMEAPQGVTGALTVAPADGQLLVTDWSGLTVIA